MRQVRIFAYCLLFAFWLTVLAGAGQCPKTLRAYMGETPVLDGVISPGEYADATPLDGLTSWIFEETEAISQSAELSLRTWVKHDGRDLYFAFDVTDNLLYGIDIDRWLPDINPDANQLTRKGWPWFGDGVEIMMNPTNSWSGAESAAGDGSSWQVVFSTHKSILHGLDSGGLSGGEPRTLASAWGNYLDWINSGAMTAAMTLKTHEEGRGYVVEWKISPDPCLEVRPGVFWDVGLGETEMGLQLEIQDVDRKEDGSAFAGMRHIGQWACAPKLQLRSWGTLVLDPGRNPKVGVVIRAVPQLWRSSKTYLINGRQPVVANNHAHSRRFHVNIDACAAPLCKLLMDDMR